MKRKIKIVIISNRTMKSHWKILLLEDLTIFKKINGGRVTKNANLVSVFEALSSKIFFALKRVPKNIITKKGIVIDKTVCIILFPQCLVYLYDIYCFIGKIFLPIY